MSDPVKGSTEWLRRLGEQGQLKEEVLARFPSGWFIIPARIRVLEEGERLTSPTDAEAPVVPDVETYTQTLETHLL